MSKFRRLILETLQEAKQVGLLYHSTSLEAALDILIDNKLWAYRDVGISTSRHLNNVYSENLEVTFVLDGDKLSNKYKLSAFRYPNSLDSYETVLQTNKNSPSIFDYRKDLIDLLNADEDETDLAITGSTLNNLSFYLVKIIINKKNLDITNLDADTQIKLNKLQSLATVPIVYMNL